MALLRFTNYEVQPVVETEGSDETRHCEAFHSNEEAEEYYRLRANEADANGEGEDTVKLFWTVYGRNPDGTAEAITDCITEEQAETLRAKLCNTVRRSDVTETVYDLTSNLAADLATGKIKHEDFADSRERLDTILHWADEFSRKYEDADWSELNYMELVDHFYAEKVQGMKAEVSLSESSLNVKTARVVSLFATPDTDQGEGLYAVVCEDGTIWHRLYKYDRDGSGPPYNQRFEWERIPGPPAA